MSNEYCACDQPMLYYIQKTPKHLVCSCGGIIPCEICFYNGKLVPARHHHVDYFVCDNHLKDAIDNVSSRGS